MKALDLFCGAGGATKGLQRAGFHVTGVDINPQPRYCGDWFIQADAMRGDWDYNDFDFIWASPPCQRYTRMQKIRNREHPDLIPRLRSQLRGILRVALIPFVIENVPGAPLENPVMLCGAMFELRTYRHRLFECSFPVAVPGHPKHTIRTEKAGRPSNGYLSVAGHFPGVQIIRDAWGVPWMNRDEVAQAIPPAYSEYIARQFLRSLP